MAGHIIVCGMGQSGYRIVSLLLRLGERVTVVARETREEWRKATVARGVEVIEGDARDVTLLVQAGVDQATCLIATTDNDLVNLEIALDTKKHRPELPVVLRIFDQTLAQQLEKAFDVRSALSMSAIAAPMFAAAAMGENAVCAFRMEEQLYVIQSLTLTSDSPLANRTMQDLGAHLHLAVLEHTRQEGTSQDVPQPETQVCPGDHVTVLSKLIDWERYVEVPQNRSEQLPGWRRALDLLLRGFHPAFWRDFMRELWRGTSRPLKTIFLILNLLILLSVGIFHLAMHLTFLDALYFVISTVTTVGYGDITVANAPPALKLYCCLLMLIGSATMATLFSIITDYIVTSRFQQILGRQNTPQAGHYIVVGLGTVGYRLVDKLYRVGAHVVAVDNDPACEFAESVRGMAPVVVGDARLRTTLEKVGAANARAVLAVTSNDAVNLGIALETKQINPKVRTVVRLADPDFAEKVKSHLQIDAALGAFLISAPTFVAAAFYTDVRHAFVQDDFLFAILHRPVRDEWHGRTPMQLHTEQETNILMRHRPGSKEFRVLSPELPLDREEWVLALVR
ncbi:MAG TPA: NAD-binding protein, partial [Chthonomonadaceae bacterium]|nr:NAD-binding protein [Chthonomonadaceae bacterium]